MDSASLFSDSEEENESPAMKKTSSALLARKVQGQAFQSPQVIPASGSESENEEIGSPNSIFRGKDVVTSTPMLSTFRKLQPLSLDMSALSEGEVENNNGKDKSNSASDSSQEFQKCNKVKRNPQKIESDSESSEGEAEAQFETAVQENLDPLDEISSCINNLTIDKTEDKTAKSKKFVFKPKTPINIIEKENNTNQIQKTVIHKTVELPGASGSGSSSSSVRISTTDESGSERDSPEVVYEKALARRNLPDLPTGRGLQRAEPKIKFIELPEASGAVPKIALSSEFQVGVKNAITKLTETIATMPKENVLAEKPTGLRIDLYDHQRYGLEWLFWREQQFPGGGILADEMGLGKTIMMIALVLKSKAEGVKRPVAKSNSWLSADTRNLVPSRSTLVIVPASVMGQWEYEIKQKARGLKVYAYHGPKRTTSAAVLVQYDFVLSTYQTVGSDIPKESNEKFGNAKYSSPLMRIQWERVILDEGHCIRNSKTLGAQAVSQLHSNYRWVATGTPIHNKPSDFQSLVKFLHLHPFDDPTVWNYWIGLKSVSAENAERLNIITKSLILRRTKDEVQVCGGNVAKIPPKTVIDIMVPMSQEERRIYDHLYSFAESQFKMFLKNQESAISELQKAANNFIAGKQNIPKQARDVNFTHIFTLLLRLRQASVHPFLITTMLEDETSDLELDDEFDPLNNDDVISRKNPVFSENFQSSKLQMLYDDLEDLRTIARTENRTMDKVVIVSQWTTLLRIVYSHLSDRGFTLTTISGEVKLSERMDIMGKFNSNPRKPQIMLLSLAAGGVGLNLIGANHLFFLDIHWNPQLELQAQDRIHRFGQTKNVTIKRYISMDTMEERVKNLQESKLELANGVLSSSKKSVGTGLSIPEMRKLFQL